MSLNAKWTTFTFMALTAVGGASFLFGGCSVTSGKPDNTEGGVGNPPPPTPPPADGGSDSPTGSACTGNLQTGKFTPPACQTALEEQCCTELKDCFNATIDKSDAAAPQADCNAFFACLADCEKPLADGGTPTQAEIQECQTTICDAASPKNVRDAYDAITTCGTAKANGVCQ